MDNIAKYEDTDTQRQTQTSNDQSNMQLAAIYLPNATYNVCE